MGPASQRPHRVKGSNPSLTGQVPLETLVEHIFHDSST